MPGENAPAGPPLTSDESAERRRTERRLRLIALHDELAVRAETADCDRLRAAYAARYLALVGVPPDRRHVFRAALEGRVGVGVDELAVHFARG